MVLFGNRLKNTLFCHRKPTKRHTILKPFAMTTTLQQQEQAQKATRTSPQSQSAKSYPSRTIVHAKLEMTEPGDHDEQEADAVANTIVSGGKIAREISGGGGSSGIAVSQQMESQLAHLQGSGRQMPEGQDITMYCKRMGGSIA